MILRIEKDWGKSPGWFNTLQKIDRVRLLADFRVSNESPEKTKTEMEKEKRRKFNRFLDKQLGPK